MEAPHSSMDRLQLLTALTYTARVELMVAGESNRYYWTWMHLGLCFILLVLSFWGFVLASSAASFSFKYNTGRKQIARAFSHGCSNLTCRNEPVHDSGYAYRENIRKSCVRWACSAQNLGSEPALDLVQESPVSGKNSVPFLSFSDATFPYRQEEVAAAEDFSLKLALEWKSFSGYSLGLSSGDFPNRDIRKLISLPEACVKCIDIWESRGLSSSSAVDNTIRLWDVEAATFRFQKKPQLFLETGTAIEEKSLLYVWDPRNFKRSLSFSLGNEFTKLHNCTVEFNDKKIYVCDDSKERVFDLRKDGAPLDEVNMDRLTPPCFMEEESALLMGNSWKSSCKLWSPEKAAHLLWF